jgi:Na+-translocating ferredoxin:NAD+ oxidoreductase RnfC subunit
LVLNVQTIIAVASAVTENTKADTKVITVANLMHKQSKAVRVNIGDSISEIVQKIFPGGYPVFYGGGIMLSEQADEDSVVDKSISFIAVSDFVQYKESPQCSHCGKCVQYCPEKLDVRRIADAVDNKKYNLIKHVKPQKCVNCGICSYVCPAGLNLMKKVKEAADNRDYERELIVGSSNLK